MLLVSKSQQAKGIRHKHAEGQNRKSPSNGPAHRRLPKDAAVRIVERQRGMPSSRPGPPSDQAPCSNPSAQPALIWLDLKRQQMLYSICHACHEEHQQRPAIQAHRPRHPPALVHPHHCGQGFGHHWRVTPGRSSNKARGQASIAAA